METSNLKNMVVLRNLPSNIVEEAIVILKANKRVKKLEKIEKIQNTEAQKIDKKEKDYIFKEAEMLVSQYLSKIEDNKKEEKISQKNKIKYERLKKYAYLSSFIIFLETLIIFFK